MKYKLVLLEPQRTTSKTGSERTDYVETRTVHAERVSISGRRSEEVSEHFADYDAVFNIRDAHPISENWRVQQLGGHLYTVVGVEPNLHRGYNTLKCNRVNE